MIFYSKVFVIILQDMMRYTQYCLDSLWIETLLYTAVQLTFNPISQFLSKLELYS